MIRSKVMIQKVFSLTRFMPRAVTVATLVSLAQLGHAALPAFIAVGEKGTLLGSADGNSWATLSSGSSKRLRSVAVKGSVAVVVGEAGTILRSVDGSNWSAVTSGVSDSLRGVCATPGGFVAVGGGSSGVILKREVQTDPDPLWWIG